MVREVPVQGSGGGARCGVGMGPVKVFGWCVMGLEGSGGFRAVPVQGSGWFLTVMVAEVLEGCGKFRKVLVQAAPEVPEGSQQR